MIRHDEAYVAGFVEAFAMFHANAYAEQKEHYWRKARGNSYCSNPFRFLMNGEQADDA
jgi:hypothetical protein